MNRTINSVRDPNPWNKDGQLKGHFVNGMFDDGMPFSVLVMGQRQAADETTQQLRDLIGKLGDFDGEERTTNNGGKELKLKSWPGKPAAAGGFGGGFRGGGGGKTWTESYAQSRECKEIEQRSIQRAVSLERAIQYGIAFGHIKDEAVTPKAILGYADEFFTWLSDVGQQQPKQPAEPPPNGQTEQYKQFLHWCDEKVKARVFIDKATVWKAAMTYANQLKHDHQSLQRCNDYSVFKTIKDKLTSPTRPENGNVVDDDTPF